MREIGVVGFHGFSDGITLSGSTVSKHAFTKCVTTLLNLGYTFRTLSEFNRYQHDGKSLYFYFDDCDSSVYEVITQELSGVDFKGTLFPISEYIDKSGDFDVIYKNRDLMSVENIKELISRGFEIGSHTATHIPLSTQRNRDTWENEIVGSKKYLEETFKVKVTFLSAPFGSYSSDLIEYALHNGYESVVTINEKFMSCSGLLVGYPAFNLDNAQTLIIKSTKGGFLVNINSLLYNQFSRGSVLLKS